ncbi:Kynurenine formamidase [Eumeta japonica]|uniref:Kynurenine formamidase n=1 Tax=Eumeta variegata TaxID=151549 RepID=A0A4C1SUE2_EUMVA|nr:Kynurenine formamidase [Eumeta japonica]
MVAPNVRPRRASHCRRAYSSRSTRFFFWNYFGKYEHVGTHIDASAHNRIFIGDIPLQKLILPGLSVEVAEWIATTYKNVVGVGVDVPSVDPASSVDYGARKILLDAGLYILENVKMDDYIPEASCTALVMPAKHRRRETGGVRLTAICPRQRLLTTPRPSYIHL